MEMKTLRSTRLQRPRHERAPQTKDRDPARAGDAMSSHGRFLDYLVAGRELVRAIAILARAR
jgi:hypothetical protein